MGELDGLACPKCTFSNDVNTKLCSMCGASLQSEDVEMQQAMDELLDSLNVKEPAARAAMSNMPKEKKLQMIIEHQLMKKSESQLPKKKKIKPPNNKKKKKKKKKS